MRRILYFALSLMLLLTLFTLAIAAEGGELTLRNGEECEAHAAGEPLPAPTAAEGSVFVGWYAEATDTLQASFLPAGAIAPADGQTEYRALFVAMAVREGSELRLEEGKEGLRFLTDIALVDLEALREAATKVEFGTIIAPGSYVKKAKGVLTPEALAAAGKTKYLDVATPGAYKKTEDTFTIAGSVSRVLDKNANLEFYAAGYLSITYTDGTVARVYAPHNATGTHRFYAQIVAAFGDRVKTEDDTHKTETEQGYSPYTEDQLSYMEAQIDKVVNVIYVSQGSKKPLIAQIQPNIDAYDAPFTATYNEDRGYFLLKVKDGEDYRFDRDCKVLIVYGGEIPLDNKSFVTISNEGKQMVIAFDSGTGNY